MRIHLDLSDDDVRRVISRSLRGMCPNMDPNSLVVEASYDKGEYKEAIVRVTYYEEDMDPDLDD